jgi:hypothetical protein
VENYSYVRLLNHGNVVDTITDSQGLSFGFGVVSEELYYSSFLVGVGSVNNYSVAKSKERKEFFMNSFVFWPEDVFYCVT